MAPMQDHGHEQETDFEAQFKTLLKPIKDLEKNWQIDVTNILERYLEMFVRQTGHNIEKLPTNFSQAAMLIQGSAHVYSKKVELVYNLTYQLFEHITKKNTTKKKTAAAAPGSQDTDIDNSVSIHEEFISLDDIPACQNLVTNTTARRSAFQTTQIGVPTLLTMLDDQEKGNSILINTKGSQVGNRSDTSLNRCSLDASGYLLSSAMARGELTNLRLSAHPTIAIRLPLPEEPPLIEQSFEESFDAGPADFDHGEPMSPLPGPESVFRGGQAPTRRSVLPVPIRPTGINNYLRECFVLLDQYKETPEVNKPVKVKRLHRIPPRLRVKPRTKNETSTPEEPIKTEFKDLKAMSHTDLNKIVFSNVSKFPKNPLKVPLLDSMNGVYWENRKKRLKELGEIRKMRLEEGSVSDDDQENNEAIFSDGPMANDGGDPLSEDDDDDERQLVAFDALPLDQSHLDNNPDIPEDLFAGSQANVPAIMTYEELAKEQIAKFLEVNARFQKGSNIGKRVCEWEERIQPFLEEEEERRPYDIHTYGSQILESFGENNRKQTLAFRNIVHGKELWEIPRYFLSSLFLANHYNVELSTSGVLEAGMDTLELTLLSRRRHHEEMEEFRAPSVNP